MLKLIIEFYLTFFVPLIYLFGLIIISSSLYSIPLYSILYALYAIFGLILSLFGLLLWVWTYFNLRSSLAVLPKAQKLIISGPYQYFSHPMYVAIILTFLGLSLAAGSIPGLFYTVFIIIPLNILRAKKEEKKLIKKFGKKYEAFKKKVLL